MARRISHWSGKRKLFVENSREPVEQSNRGKLEILLTSEFNEVAEGDLGGEVCKTSEPLNSC